MNIETAFRRLAPHLLLIVFASLLIFPLMLGKVLYWGDIGLYFAPMYDFQREVLKHGQLSLWNPYILGGQPFVGNPQMGWLYPTNLFLPFLSVGRYLTVISFLHLFFAGEFTLLYLRNRRVGVAASLVGAMTFMGCDAIVSRLQFPPMLLAVVYLPLILYAIDRILSETDRFAFPLLVVSVALCILAAHAQVTYLIIITISLYALLRVLSKPRPDHYRLAFRLLLCGLFGVGLCLPYLLPVVELTKHSPRQELTVFGVDRFVLSPVHLLNLLFPHFTGHPANGDYWAEGNAWEPSVFVGWVPLVFALKALHLRPRTRSVRFWGCFALLTLWLSLGTNGGMFWIAYYVMPGISLFHDPARFLMLTSFAVAILAGYGVDCWLKEPNRPSRYSIVVVCGAALPLLSLGYLWNPAIDENLFVSSLPAPPSTSHTTLYPYFTQIWDPIVTEGYTDYGADDPLATRRQFGSYLPNATLATRIITQDGYEPVAIAGAVEMQSLLRQAVKKGIPQAQVLLEARGVEELRSPPLTVSFSPLSSLESGWRIATRLRHVEGKLRTTHALNDPGFNPQNEAIISDADTQVIGSLGRSVDETKISDAQNTLQISARLNAPNQWTVEIFKNRNRGILITPLTDYPGWHCTLNGKPAPIFQVNMANMGVVVPEGDSSLILTYRPASFRIGLYFGGILWCVFVAWTVSLCLKRPQP